MSHNSEPFKIAVCGHVDHGKSTLIGRLLLDTRSLPDEKIKELRKIAKTFGEETQLAYLSDQLKEERDRNITIETTQVFFKSRKRHYCLIDTPGHLEFIRNMLTGTSQADAALLLVDITEGIADQTRRHAYLLKFLSLPRIIVLINKMDVVSYSAEAFAKTKNELLALFSGLGLCALAIVPASAKLSENITKPSKKMLWYKGPPLITAMDNIIVDSEKTSKDHLRLPVQDVYHIQNEKIIVGRISAGSIFNGQDITVLPKNLKANVKAIKIFNKKATSAVVNESIGLTLTNDLKIERGDILCTQLNTSDTIKTFRGNIFWLSAKNLIVGQTVEIHCATQKFQCLVDKLIEVIDPVDLSTTTATALKENQAGIVEFSILTPAVLEKYSQYPELGRYTIEHNNNLSGVGTVLDIMR